MIYLLGDIKECKNQDDDCDTMDSQNECQRLPDYLMQNCKKECEFCGPGRKMFIIIKGALIILKNRIKTNLPSTVV